MAELLTDLLAAGLIEKLDGDDERFAKMERAAKVVSQELVADRPGLIRTILAGLDPDVPANDPAIVRAERALAAEWKSVSTVYTSPPIGLYRAILLEACDQAADENNNAAILWLTAADTLPLLRLGKEEPAVHRMLENLAARAEEAALVVPSEPIRATEGAPRFEIKTPAAVAAPTPRTVDRQALLLRVAATAGSHYRDNRNIPGANEYWPNNGHYWSYDFADRMHAVLADELDALANEIAKQPALLTQQLQAFQTSLLNALNKELPVQQRWVEDALKASEAHRQADKLRLEALWWSEAVYSNSLRCSYRDLPAPLAAVVMAIDLLERVTTPTPASVSYLLAEAVHRLPSAEFDLKSRLPDLLGALRETRSRLPKGWTAKLRPPPTEGRLSLRDLIILALGNQEWNVEAAMHRARLTEDIALSLPVLARALFRQEQAVQLAGNDQ